jgi:MFS family permease
MLALVLFINYIDRGALPTAAHSLQLELNLDAAQLGVLLSAFFWTYSWVQLPVGWAAERYGASRILSAGLVLWALVTMLMGAAHSFAILLGARLLLGIAESVGFPSVSKLLAEVVPPKKLGTANGIISAAYIFGPAVGTFVGGKIIAAHGWRVTFFLFGGLSLLWLLPWSRIKLPPRAAHETDSTQQLPFSRILKEPALWGTSLGLFAINYCFYLSITWFPYYLETARGLSTADMANVAGLGFAINALTALATGWGIDRYIAGGGSATQACKGVMGLCCVGIVLCMLAMALGSRPWALAGMYAYQVINGVSSPGCYAVSQILAGPRACARWVGMQNGIGNLAGALAPWATGEIVALTHAFTYAFILAAAVTFLGVIAWVWMLPRITPIHWDSPTTAGAEPQGS